MMKYLCLLILLSASKLADAPGRFLVVWNIGQGAWSTVISNNECWHFDMGGEHFPAAVSAICRGKFNKLFLSHDDWDHMAFMSRLAHWPHVCLIKSPREITTAHKRQIIESWPLCPVPGPAQEIEWNLNGHSSNDLSRVYFLAAAHALFPGDSTQGEETAWARYLGPLKVQWWILGHHGSKTSSSDLLIKNIGHPWAAIASARFKKYHHPHPSVMARLRAHGIPLLKTEDWGNIWINL
jgi:competence protein ComEC